jgi:N-glycosylase/DNA lyase
VVRAFPEFLELYKEVFAFRYQHRELISMYSEALRILDANTVQYMVEEQKKEILELTEALEDTSKALEDSSRALEDKSKALEDTSRALKDKSKALQDTSRALEEEHKARLEKDKEIMYLRALLKATKDI